MATQSYIFENLRTDKDIRQYVKDIMNETRSKENPINELYESALAQYMLSLDYF